MEDITLVLTTDELKQLCELLWRGMQQNTEIPISADPPTWTVFADGSVSVSLHDRTLQNVIFKLYEY